MAKQEAIEWINGEITWHSSFPDSEELIKALNMAIVALEQEPKWIPVTEELPKQQEKSYWVCTDCGYQCECRWTNVNHFWTELTTDWHWHFMDVPQYQKVVAWMPLPEPYKESEEEQMASEMRDYCERYEPTYNSEDGSM